MRVERTKNPSERRGSEQPRQAERGRRANAPQDDPNPGHTPGKTEGTVEDVEEALRRQKE